MYPFIFTKNVKTAKPMKQITLFLKEIEIEAVTTHKMLSLVPTEKFTWKPHTKSMDMYNLAAHIANIPLWIDYIINLPEMDFALPEFGYPELKTGQSIVEYADNNFEICKAALANADESKFSEDWYLKYQGQIYIQMPKADFIRHSISQIIHHRAQLGVYLRLLDIPIPGSYGPSADEMGG
jgi:uncharacterized damage-inducible protein DinB